jgi:hypothetical protein
MLELFNFHPVSTKFPMSIENIILTNRLGFFVLGIATFWGVNYITNLAQLGDFMYSLNKRAD